MANQPCRYRQAIKNQPLDTVLIKESLSKPLGTMLFIMGNVFVLSSMFKLGILGTYLGDHFGIIKEARITTFPFNVSEHPMYEGSTMLFLSYAIWYG